MSTVLCALHPQILTLTYTRSMMLCSYCIAATTTLGGRLTESSDVYSFGVVLLEVASCEPPLVPGQGHIVQRVEQKIALGNIVAVADAMLGGVRCQLDVEDRGHRHDVHGGRLCSEVGHGHYGGAAEGESCTGRGSSERRWRCEHEPGR